MYLAEIVNTLVLSSRYIITIRHSQTENTTDTDIDSAYLAGK